MRQRRDTGALGRRHHRLEASTEKGGTLQVALIKRHERRQEAIGALLAGDHRSDVRRLAGKGRVLRMSGLHVELAALVRVLPALHRAQGEQVAGDLAQVGKEPIRKHHAARMLA